MKDKQDFKHFLHEIRKAIQKTLSCSLPDLEYQILANKFGYNFIAKILLVDLLF